MDSHQRAPGEAWAAGSTEDCFWKTLISSLEMSVFSRDLHFLRTLRACGMAGGPVGPEGGGRGPAPPTTGWSAEACGSICTTLIPTCLPDRQVRGKRYKLPTAILVKVGPLPPPQGAFSARALGLRHPVQGKPPPPGFSSFCGSTLLSQISIPLSAMAPCQLSRYSSLSSPSDIGLTAQEARQQRLALRAQTKVDSLPAELWASLNPVTLRGPLSPARQALPPFLYERDVPTLCSHPPTSPEPTLLSSALPCSRQTGQLQGRSPFSARASVPCSVLETSVLSGRHVSILILSPLCSLFLHCLFNRLQERLRPHHIPKMAPVSGCSPMTSMS